jgi:hypothetical protein
MGGIYCEAIREWADRPCRSYTSASVSPLKSLCRLTLSPEAPVNDGLQKMRSHPDVDDHASAHHGKIKSIEKNPGQPDLTGKEKVLAFS